MSVEIVNKYAHTKISVVELSQLLVAEQGNLSPLQIASRTAVITNLLLSLVEDHIGTIPTLEN